MFRKISQRGDTIVEVLLALAVLSGVIGGAYAIANRAMKQSQQAYERSQALKIAEGQIEQLNYLSESQPNLLNDIKDITSTEKKCINNYKNEIGATLYELKENCKKDDLYAYNIAKQSGEGTNDNQYKVIVAWDSIGSNATEKVELIYRVK